MVGHQREHRGSWVYMAMSVWMYVSSALKMSIYTSENSHKGVLYCVVQNNQCLSIEINTIIIWCLFSVYYKTSSGEAQVPASFMNSSTSEDLQITHKQSKQQAFKINVIFVIAFPFLSFPTWQKLWDRLREGIRIIAKEAAFTSMLTWHSHNDGLVFWIHFQILN